MNRKIKAYQAIIYIVLFYLAAVLFLLGPGKLLEKDRLLAGAENPVGTVEVREDQQVQQVLMLLLLLVVQLLLSRGRQLDEGAIMAPCSSCSAVKRCVGLCGVVDVVFYVSE